MATVKQQLIAALAARGEQIRPNPNTRTYSPKYVKMTRTHKSYANSATLRDSPYFFIGSAGGLRTGRTTSSSVFCDQIKDELLKGAPT